MGKQQRSFVVARRELRLSLKGKQSPVLVEIERPRKRRRFGTATCRFRIENLPGHRNEWIRIHGIDSLAALLTAIHIIHVHLYYPIDGKRMKLEWLGTQDLGIPLTAGPFTNNRNAKGRIERLNKQR